MHDPKATNGTFDSRDQGRLLDVLIRAGLILALVMLCYQIFSPFLVLMVWALVLAITLYPLNQALARRLGGRKGWAATLIALIGITLIVVPTAVLVSSVGDSVQQLIADVQQNTLEIPPPDARVAELAPGGREDLRGLGKGPYRPAGADREPAAEDR